MQDRNGVVERMANAVPEQRRDVGISVRGLARLSGVSRETITKLEHGGRINPLLLFRLASTLTVLEGYAPPAQIPDPPKPKVAELDDHRAGWSASELMARVRQAVAS